MSSSIEKGSNDTTKKEISLDNYDHSVLMFLSKVLDDPSIEERVVDFLFERGDEKLSIKSKTINLIDETEETEDIDFYIAAIKVFPEDRDVALAVAKKKGMLLPYYLSKEFRSDKEIVGVVVTQCGELLGVASEELKDDKDLVTSAMEQDGKALRFASERLRDDEDVVSVAVEESGWALEHASDRLRGKKEVVIKAVGVDGEALKYASEELKNDKEVVLTAVKSNSWALRYASKEMRNDADVALTALETSVKLFDYISEELKRDINFLVRAIALNEDIKGKIDKEWFEGFMEAYRYFIDD